MHIDRGLPCLDEKGQLILRVACVLWFVVAMTHSAYVWQDVLTDDVGLHLRVHGVLVLCLLLVCACVH